MNSKIIISNNAEELSEQFAQILLKELKWNKGYFNIALSGGSTPKVIYKYLADNYSTKIDWGKIRFFWGDERCVPPDHPDSNYKTAFDLLISKVDIPPENILRIHGETDAGEEAVNYSGILKEKLPADEEIPVFDLIMLGLGEDGHTASIFYDSIQLFNSQSVCAVALHPVSLQKRITITGNVINRAAKVVFIATGESKSKVADMIISKKPGSEKLPAAYVSPYKGELIWLLDKPAAGLLH